MSYVKGIVNAPMVMCPSTVEIWSVIDTDAGCVESVSGSDLPLSSSSAWCFLRDAVVTVATCAATRRFSRYLRIRSAFSLSVAVGQSATRWLRLQWRQLMGVAAADGCLVVSERGLERLSCLSKLT